MIFIQTLQYFITSLKIVSWKKNKYRMHVLFMHVSSNILMNILCYLLYDVTSEQIIIKYMSQQIRVHIQN